MFYSIVIPVYNKEYSIKRCLESVFSQSFKNYQVIIVNDGSSDNSLSVIKEEVKKYSCYDVFVINQENKGVSYARNIAVSHAKYEYICFLDADDSWDYNYLEEMFRLIKNKNEASMFVSGYKRFINNKYQQEYVLPRYDLQYINFFRRSARYPISVTCSTIVKKNVFIRLGGFPVGKTIGEDLYVWARIAEDFKVAYIAKPLVNIFHREDESRNQRIGATPYILEYYSNNQTYNKDLIRFLKYIYISHLYSSYNNKNFSEFSERFKLGFKIFPVFSIVSLPILFFPLDILKEARNKIKG